MGNGIAVWKVDVDLLREQDKNARVMSPDKFERMKGTIAEGGRLESLPLCVIQKNTAGNEEFHIISGHHRTRAARAAGLRKVFVMVIEEELTHDQIRAKQLAHNALTGYDDPVLLAELFSEIQSVEAKLESGIFDGDIDFELPSIQADDIVFDFDYEMLQILFLPKQKEKFDEVLNLLKKDAEVYLADKADFEKLRGVLAEMSGRENIRNVSALFAKMLDIVEAHYKQPNLELYGQE